jgi:pimeloyl-ACP methyl ester carboxylesterase
MPDRASSPARLHFIEAEDPSPATHPTPVVFIHGAGASSAVWLYQLRALRHGPRALAVDLPGHGLSADAASIGSLNDYADALLALLADIGLGPCVLVGHALGAAVAMHAFNRRPDAVRALCLCAATHGMPAHPLVAQALRGPLSAWIRMMEDLLYSPSTPRRFVEKAVESGFQAPREVLQRDFDLWLRADLCDPTPLAAAAADPEAAPPTLLICGADDALVPVPLSEALLRLLPGARLEVIEEAGHMVMLERHKRFNALLLQLLSDLHDLPASPLKSADPS